MATRIRCTEPSFLSGQFDRPHARPETHPARYRFDDDRCTVVRTDRVFRDADRPGTDGRGAGRYFDVYHVDVCTLLEHVYVLDGDPDPGNHNAIHPGDPSQVFLGDGLLGFRVGVGTVVRLTVETHEYETWPDDQDFDPWEHVVDVPFVADTGRIVVSTGTSYTGGRILVGGDSYRARVYLRNLDPETDRPVVCRVVIRTDMIDDPESVVVLHDRAPTAGRRLPRLCPLDRGGAPPAGGPEGRLAEPEM